MHLIPILLTLLGLSVTPPEKNEAGRDLLWRVIQACALNHRITGASFPCLAVESPNGADTGYAVLRAPNQGVRIIVTPLVRTIGVEAARLRGKDAPDYFADAWAARHFVTDDLTKRPERGDVALAVNSRPGRSQDQLHIHVGCVRRDVKQVLARMDATIRAADWTPVKVLPRAPHYSAHYEPGHDLSGVNVFDSVAHGLAIDPSKMADATIVVVGAEPSGFMILARKKLANSSDQPHGEALLDTDCDPFRPR